MTSDIIDKDEIELQDLGFSFDKKTRQIKKLYDDTVVDTLGPATSVRRWIYGYRWGDKTSKGIARNDMVAYLESALALWDKAFPMDPNLGDAANRNPVRWYKEPLEKLISDIKDQSEMIQYEQVRSNSG